MSTSRNAKGKASSTTATTGTLATTNAAKRKRSIHFEVGSDVYVKPGDPSDPLYVAKVVSLGDEGDGGDGDGIHGGSASKGHQGRRLHQKVKLKWYYRPEEVKGGRQVWHGVQELLLSNWADWNYVQCIEGTCRVHALADYQTLQQVTEDDYFCRFEYSPLGPRTFSPDVVPVYCHCALPYNPDLLMVECEACNDWFHPECAGIRDLEAVRKHGQFTCTPCTRASQAIPKIKKKKKKPRGSH